MANARAAKTAKQTKAARKTKAAKAAARFRSDQQVAATAYKTREGHDRLKSKGYKSDQDVAIAAFEEHRAVESVRREAKKLKKSLYEADLEHLQIELVKLQEWIKDRGLRVVVLFEGRDAAGKGGAIKRIVQNLNPRICPGGRPGHPDRAGEDPVVLPALRGAPGRPPGEMVLFDRSWYNRAGVERVMGFCTESEYRDFLRSCPEFERMLVRSGIVLIKYWFSVSDEEQERRFRDRIETPTKRWKLSPMDLESRKRWADYSRAKDQMLAHTDIAEAPWWVVDADVKRRARLNCIRHLLSTIPYKELKRAKVRLPPRQKATGYVRPPHDSQKFVPDHY